jgi:hypothetical protein
VYLESEAGASHSDISCMFNGKKAPFRSIYDVEWLSMLRDAAAVG